MVQNNKHISKEHLNNFYSGTIKDEDYLLVLEHISQCHECSECFANLFDSNSTLKMPLNLKENILEQINNTNKVKNVISSNKQFFYYTLKVSFAMLVTLMITFSGIFEGDFSNMSPSPSISASFSHLNNFSQKLYNFSNKRINLEVFNDAKKEK